MFLDNLPPHGPARNKAVADAIAAGKIDPPLWAKVTCNGVELEVSSDYVTIDGARIPMTAANAQAAADAFDALLPSIAVVEAIEKVAHIVPFKPWPRYQDDSQLATSTIRWREANIRAAMANMPKGILIAGCLKDIIMQPYSLPGHVLIFGGLDANGKRVQGLQTSATAHGDWFDGGYAHGVRLVRRACKVDGKPALLDDVYRRGLLGPVARIRYDAPATKPTPTVSAVLRRGDRGPSVIALQGKLRGRGAMIDIDGIFGPATERAVIDFQRSAGLNPDGIVGPKTRAALYSEADPMTPFAAAKALGLPVPLHEAEVDAIFGGIPWSAVPGNASAISVPVSWQRDNLVTVTIPQLIGVHGAHPKGLCQINVRIAEPYRSLWAAWEKRGKLSLVKSFAGTVAFRRVRGGTLVSRHARGLAFDINAPQNARDTPGAPRGAFGSVVELFEEMHEHGFTSGVLYPTPDAMHVEAFRI